MPRAEYAQHRPQQQRRQAGRQRQEDGGPQAVHDLLGHRLIGIDGGAHVASEQVARVSDKLDMDRLVQAVFFRQCRDHFRRGGVGARQQPDGIARSRVDDNKIDTECHDNTEKSCHGSLADVLYHRSLLPFKTHSRRKSLLSHCFHPLLLFFNIASFSVFANRL